MSRSPITAGFHNSDNTTLEISFYSETPNSTTERAASPHNQIKTTQTHQLDDNLQGPPGI